MKPRKILLALAALLTVLSLGHGAHADSICARATIDTLSPTACIPLP